MEHRTNHRLTAIADILTKIADLRFQQKVWFGGGQSRDRVESYGEAVNLLDDHGFFDLTDNSIYGNLSEADRTTIADFQRRLMDYDMHKPVDKRMLADEAWIGIGQLSLRVCAVIRNHDPGLADENKAGV